MSLNLEPIRFSYRRAFILLFCLGWFTMLCWWHRNVVIDDPWITFQYARNLLEGKGLVFNPGERLEGYSNFTWVLISAIGIGANLEPLSFVRLVSWLCAATLFFLLVFGWRRKSTPDEQPREVLEGAPPPWEQRRDEMPWRSGTAAVFLAASFPLAVWTMGGLETVFYTLLLFLFTTSLAWTWEKQSSTNCLLLSGSLLLLALTRPEGFMWAGLLIPIAAMDRWRTRWFVHGGIFIVLFAIYTIWRVQYFGQFTPNTVAAKTGGSIFSTIWSGLTYLGGYVFSAPFGLFILGGITLGMNRPWRGFRTGFTPRDKLLIVLTLVLGLQLVFVIAVGGDWMPGKRFLVPILPQLCLLAALAMTSWAFFVRLTVIWFFLTAHFLHARQDSELRWSRWAAKESGRQLTVQPLIETARVLRELGDERALFAATEAGVMPYYSRMRFIDMLGLVNAHIAGLPGGLHEKYDAAHVLSLNPDFIVLGVVEENEELVGVWSPDRQMLQQQIFKRDYHEVERVERIMPTTLRELRQGYMVIYQRRGYKGGV